MRRKIYVVTHGTLWQVKCDHCTKSVVVSTQLEGMRLAKKHVANLLPGTLAQIVVQGKDSKFRAEWTYGKDPFPPRG